MKASAPGQARRQKFGWRKRLLKVLPAFAFPIEWDFWPKFHRAGGRQNSRGLLCSGGRNDSDLLSLEYEWTLIRFSHIWLCVMLWTVACQAPLSIRFSRQQYWSGLPCPSPGDLLDPGIWQWSLVFQFSSDIQSCLTLCNPMDCSTPGFPVHHQLLKLAESHVHRVSDAIQPSHPQSSPSPPAFNLSQYQVFSSESVLCIRWPKYWSFSFSISPTNEYSGLISLRIDWFDLLEVQGTLKSLLQHHSSKASILWCSVFFMAQLSHPYLTTGKTMALTRRTLVGKEMSLLFNKLSRLVIAFLPRSKYLLISWLQSPSAVIFEPKKIKCHCFHCFPIYLPWSDGTGPLIFRTIYHKYQKTITIVQSQSVVLNPLSMRNWVSETLKHAKWRPKDNFWRRKWHKWRQSLEDEAEDWRGKVETERPGERKLSQLSRGR